ncbi:hypothetical protein GCM10022204_36500 [Microlunatus aurantiacus]|uniref:Uncharacterized protein n=1 Tax=Microlunatus aurantiacus TaxID=446786 RepID=A0ABP7E5M6_9ACTN
MIGPNEYPTDLPEDVQGLREIGVVVEETPQRTVPRMLLWYRTRPADHEPSLGGALGFIVYVTR